MRRYVSIAVCLVLSLGFAATAAAKSAERWSYTWQYAQVAYASDVDPHGPGVHSSLTVRFSSVDTRTSDGTMTQSIVQIISAGYELDQGGGMIRDWYGAYEQLTSPADPSLGGVEPSLASAWVQAGPITFVCYLGQCPTMPEQISVSGSWTADGPETATMARATDDIGTEITLRIRQRSATAAIEFSGGSVSVPPILVQSVIASQVQTSVAPRCTRARLRGCRRREVPLARGGKLRFPFRSCGAGGDVRADQRRQPRHPLSVDVVQHRSDLFEFRALLRR
jgi:hypothetical protein